MDDTQQAFLNMLLKVQDHLEDNSVAYSDHAQIAPAKALLDAEIQSIIEAAGRATEDTTGVTEDKEQDRTELEQIMFKVTRAVWSYATDNSDNKLAKKVKYTASELEKMQDTELHFKALRLVALIDPVIAAALVNYRITAGDLTTLNTAISNYFAAIPEPKDAIEDKTTAGSEVDRHINTSRKILEKLDGYVDSYRYDSATISLWENYQLARAIDDNPSGGGADVYEDTANPMSTEKIMEELTYNAATPVNFENLGMVTLQFALSNNGMPTGNWVSVNPGTSQETAMGAMAPSATDMVVQNNSGTPCAYRVTIG
ncbi:MAG: hypothetical protein POELPBGB_02180 [Bacteroidia bacterium]|nr:hypothetical protein [Bacteroidia bacterium]